MKEFENIPVTKVQRATKFVSTGARIGTNYLKHYAKRLVNADLSKEELHEDNARDIYNSLSELKGSALKVAQMLSMDKSLLPSAYQQQFAMAQYSAPPLSYPLVVKTFRKYFNKSPDEIFDSFSHQAINAASMGQVHLAALNGKKLAVKVQYPGISDSVKSDLAMVKPIALTMFKLNPVEYEEFIQEVELRMLEETDYDLELRRSIDLSGKTSHLRHIVFPKYYPEFSAPKILVMDWIEGRPLGEVLKTKMPRHTANRLGQAMWDFYHFQMHELKSMHADPHPGNFIITPDEKLGIIDFGCVKEIPEEFHKIYFTLLDRTLLEDQKIKEEIFSSLRFIYPDDSPKDRQFFITFFTRMVELLSRPFGSDEFDFSDNQYFDDVHRLGQELSSLKEFRNSSKARGVRDALYINRSYFGLYSLLHEMGAAIRTGHQEMVSAG